MELATLHLKLSGDPQNTVFLYNVSPAELAVYAYMHGEDCVQSLKITAVDKDADEDNVLDKLREKFATENAQKALDDLFPGVSPRLPKTFRSLGYDPVGLEEERVTIARAEPDLRTNCSAAAAESIRKKIAEARTIREQDAGSVSSTAAGAGTAILGSNVAPVNEDDLVDQLDGTSGDIDDTLGDDPIDEEMSRVMTGLPVENQE